MNIQKQQKPRFDIVLVAMVMMVAGATSYFSIGHTDAAPFQRAFIRLDRMSATTATGGRVCVQPATANTEASVNVRFPTTAATDYVVNATPANWTVNTTGLDSGQTAWPGIGTATAVSGKTVTFPSGELTVGTLYCFNFSGTNTLTTSSAGLVESVLANITTRTVTPTDIDTEDIDLHIITNDQVVITAVVPPSFSMTLSGNTDSFTTNLSTGSIVSTTGRTITITSNSSNGWIVWARDLNDNGSGRGSLRSATASNYNLAGSAAPGTVRTPTIGQEDYGLGVTLNTDATGGGAVTINGAYLGTSNQIGTLDPTGFRPIASASGTANGDIINLNHRATIGGQTPAASDYTDTVTYVGAGIF